MQSFKLAFIGGGNMASALIGGLTGAGFQADHITVADPNQAALTVLAEQYEVNTTSDNQLAVNDAEAVVLAIKPQLVEIAVEPLKAKPQQLFISIAAGTTISHLAGLLCQQQPIIRAMPNTPALIGLGVTGIYANRYCSTQQRDRAQSVLQAVGEAVWIEQEADIDMVTAVSGSGPAYFFYMIEALREAGQSMGLPFETAARLALHTAQGAGVMAAQSDLDVAELRRRVTSPGGTTQAALESLAAADFKTVISHAVEAATERGRALAKGN